MKDIMASLEGGKYVVPEPFPYEEARKLFKGAALLSVSITLLVQASMWAYWKRLVSGKKGATLQQYVQCCTHPATVCDNAIRPHF